MPEYKSIDIFTIEPVEIIRKNDISSLVTSKYPLNKKDIILSSYISITPVPYYETVEEKINELMKLVDEEKKSKNSFGKNSIKNVISDIYYLTKLN